MANEVALTAAQIAPVFPEEAEIYSFVAAEAITQGEAVYMLTSAGTVGVADANVANKQQFRGIALEAAAAGQAISVLKRGHCYGFTVSALSYDDVLYLSDTAGDLSTVAGTLTVNCGRVVALSDKPTYTKVVYIDADWLREWA
jgi:hypothetical protein